MVPHGLHLGLGLGLAGLATPLLALLTALSLLTLLARLALLPLLPLLALSPLLPLLSLLTLLTLLPLLATLALPFAWELPGSAWLWAMLVLLGVFSTLGHYLLILGYGRASPATLTPFLYFQIAFATLAGWLVFSHAPDRWVLMGIVVIAVCGVASTWLSGPRKVALPESEPSL